MKEIRRAEAERKPITLIKKSEMAKYVTMEDAIDCMAVAFSALSSGECHVPQRSIVSTRDGALTFLLKPAFLSNEGKSSIKVITQKNEKTIPGIPTILGIVLLIDTETGEILSIMDGEFITALRTGAASGLATKLLAREDASKAAVFGCGTQGRTQLEAVNAVRDLERVWIFDKSRSQTESYAAEMAAKIKGTIEIAEDLSLVKEVDIICTAANSTSPLFRREHVKEGAHINAIGSFKPEMQELDPELIVDSRIYFDDKESCMNESGDFLKAAEKYKDIGEHIVGEIGDCVLQKIPGRRSPEEITLFKSVGTAVQDLVVANTIYEKSKTEQFGTEIKLYE